jgi:hypothetical protein
MKSWTIFLLLCAVDALLPLRGERTISSVDFVGEIRAGLLPPDAFPIGLSDRDHRLAKAFPGQIRVFTEGPRTWVVRRVTQPTRRLHPAADCLRAVGYRLTPGPLFQERAGPCWSESTATRGSEHWRVRERIVDGGGQNWTDVSAWFWDAAFDRTRGPWWAVTVIERRD